MTDTVIKAKKLLKENNQEDIIKILDKIDTEKQEKLAREILKLDFKQLHDLYEETKEKPEILEKKIEHIKYSDKYKLSKEQTEEYTKLGENVIKNKKYAVVTMAGGQGTRLGHKGPKGTFKLEVENGPKFLFQILAENLETANKKYDIVIPWYIMTSTENNEETVRFFEEHEYFGYPKDFVKMFL